MKTKGDKVPEEDRGSVTDSIKAPEGEKQMGKKLRLVIHEDDPQVSYSLKFYFLWFDNSDGLTFQAHGSDI